MDLWDDGGHWRVGGVGHVKYNERTMRPCMKLVAGAENHPTKVAQTELQSGQIQLKSQFYSYLH